MRVGEVREERVFVYMLFGSPLFLISPPFFENKTTTMQEYSTPGINLDGKVFGHEPKIPSALKFVKM